MNPLYAIRFNTSGPSPVYVGRSGAVGTTTTRPRLWLIRSKAVTAAVGLKDAKVVELHLLESPDDLSPEQLDKIGHEMPLSVLEIATGAEFPSKVMAHKMLRFITRGVLRGLRS